MRGGVVIRDPAISFFLVIICLAATFSVVSGTNVDNSRVFFDCSTQGFPGFENQGPAGFSAFKTHLEESGCRVDDTISRGENLGVISSSTLSGYDTVFIVNPLRVFSRSEVNQLTAFAEDGGTLVVVCDSPKARSPANLILQRFDLLFQQELLLNTTINALPGSPVVQCAIPLNYGPDDALEPLPRYEWVKPDRLAIPHATDWSRIYALNGTADRTYDLLTGTEGSGGERALMMAIPASDGTVIALGTKELLTNYRYAEGAHLTRVLMDLFEGRSPGGCAIWNSGVAHYPDRLSIKFKEDMISLSSLTLTNFDDQPVSVDISASATIKDFLDPVDTVLLEAGENATVYLRFQDREAMYGYVQGNILLTMSRTGSEAECTSVIPFEAERV